VGADIASVLSLYSIWDEGGKDRMRIGRNGG